MVKDVEEHAWELATENVLHVILSLKAKLVCDFERGMHVEGLVGRKPSKFGNVETFCYAKKILWLGVLCIEWKGRGFFFNA